MGLKNWIILHHLSWVIGVMIMWISCNIRLTFHHLTNLRQPSVFAGRCRRYHRSRLWCSARKRWASEWSSTWAACGTRCSGARWSACRTRASGASGTATHTKPSRNSATTTRYKTTSIFSIGTLFRSYCDSFKMSRNQCVLVAPMTMIMMRLIDFFNPRSVKFRQLLTFCFNYDFLYLFIHFTC